MKPLLSSASKTDDSIPFYIKLFDEAVPSIQPSSEEIHLKSYSTIISYQLQLLEQFSVLFRQFFNSSCFFALRSSKHCFSLFEFFLQGKK